MQIHVNPFSHWRESEENYEKFLIAVRQFIIILTTVIFIIPTVILLKLQRITKKLLCCSFPQPCQYIFLTSTESLLQFTYHGPDPDIRQLRLHSQGASLANIYDPYSGKVVVSESVVQSYKKKKNNRRIKSFPQNHWKSFKSVKTSVKA